MSTLTLSLPQLSNEIDGIMYRTSPAGLEKPLTVGGLSAVSDIQNRFTQSVGPTGAAWLPLRFPRLTGGEKPLSNFGLLANSFSHAVTSPRLDIGTALPHAPLMNFGGTVRPKRSKYLTIPMTLKAFRAGSARRIDGLRFRYVGGAGAFLVDEDGTPQWRLVKKMTVPARPFIGWSEEWSQDFREMLAEYLTTGRIT